MCKHGASWGGLKVIPPETPCQWRVLRRTSQSMDLLSPAIQDAIPPPRLGAVRGQGVFRLHAALPRFAQDDNLRKFGELDRVRDRLPLRPPIAPVSYTHLRAHET